MPDRLAYLAAISQPLMITLIVNYAVKALVFLVASIVAIRTKDDQRRDTCVKLAKMSSLSRPWPHRLTRTPKS
jgi:hypothetical protein